MKDQVLQDRQSALLGALSMTMFLAVVVLLGWTLSLVAGPLLRIEYVPDCVCTCQE